ncbi:MAG: NAD(P)-binding protein, partial [Terriglobales bacterium]
MSPTRRDFIRYVVAGSVAAGCPADLALLAEPPAPRPAIDGEQNEICHQVRDGHHFSRPPISARHDVIIVGGGVSGLSAAYFLRERDFLLLEKETHWGGNAYLEELDGQAFATGAAFIEKSETPVVELATQLGLELLPINSFDGTFLKGEFIPDTWATGIDKLPYPRAVRESFRKFRDVVLALDLEQREQELDNIPFSRLFRGYAPEVKLWWDTFGPSNWGAKTEETSALVGAGGMHEVYSESEEDGRMAWPGGNGAVTRRLAEVLL